MGRKKSSAGLVAGLLGLAFTAVFALLRLAVRLLGGLAGLLASKARGPGKPTPSLAERMQAEQEAKFDGLTFAPAPGADDPNRLPRGKSTLPGYDEPPCTRCGKAIGTWPAVFHKKGETTVHVWCKRCQSKLPDGWRFSKGPAIVDLACDPPKRWSQAHLPAPKGKPSPYTGNGECSKCRTQIVDQHHDHLWIPTNSIIRLCPSCEAKKKDHFGWGSQMNFVGIGWSK